VSLPRQEHDQLATPQSHEIPDSENDQTMTDSHNPDDLVLHAATEEQREQFAQLARALEDKSAWLTGPDQQEVQVPPEFYGLLKDILDKLRKGQPFTVAPSDTLVTTQQAAQLLNVTREFLNHLIVDKQINIVNTRYHRKIRLDDVLNLRERRYKLKQSQLADLMAFAEENEQAVP